MEEEKKKEKERRRMEADEVKTSKPIADEKTVESPGEKESKSEGEEEEDSKMKRKIRKSKKERSSSIVSGSSSIGETAARKEFKLMSKRLTRNLKALEILNDKIEEAPQNLTNGSEDLKQLRTTELIQKMESLEVEYESDEDMQSDLEDLTELMDQNNAIYRTIKNY